MLPQSTEDHRFIAVEKERNMPDTGEPREIKQRIDAREVQIKMASKKLLQKLKMVTDRIGGKRTGAKEPTPSGQR
jgi:hypothetical protein